MQKVILNPTPVRTSENYGINDLKVDLKIPKVKNFENYTIISSDVDKLKTYRVQSGDFRGEIYSDIGLTMEQNFDLLIQVPDFTKIDETIILEFNFDEDNDVLTDNIKILYGRQSEANFLIKYKSEGDEKHFHYLKQTTLGSADAKGTITIVNMLNNESDSIIAIENDLDRAANIDYTFIDLGGKNKISNYHAKLEGNDSINNFNNIYLGTDKELLDLNYNVELFGEKSNCEIDVQGAIKDSAKKNFKGTIDFKEGCKKAIGHENENCMVLSKEARSKSLPMLLCHEEDVDGAHGVASGKPDESKIFYMMTKGISYEDARRLLVKANLDKIVNLVDDENTKIEINDYINSKL